MSGVLGGLIAAFPTPITGSFESIATVAPSGTGTVTFSSIPSTYKSLQIRYTVRASTGLATNQDLRVRFNGDSGTNYARHNLTGNGASATSNAAITQAQWQINDGATDTTTLSNTFVGGVIDLIDYASTSKTKTVRNLWGYDANGSGIISLYDGLWNSTSAINSISFTIPTGNYATGTSFALYGIKGS